MNKLTVFKNAEGWFVRYDAGPDLDEVLAVMGTDTIPLPFTLQASAEEVLISLQVRMHDADITLEQEIAPGMVWNAQRPAWTRVETSTEEES